MNAHDLDQAIDQPHVPAPEPESPTQPVKRSFAGIDEAALAYARKFQAIDDQGVLWCIKCNERHGQLPHLCCTLCIEKHRRGWR